MKHTLLTRSVLSVLVLIALTGGVSLGRLQTGAAEMAPSASPSTTSADPAGTAFTYQGQLKNNGSPVNGSCDLTFDLWDSATDGSPVIGTDTLTQTLTITDGLFTTLLDFGAGAFDGDARWLGIAVRCPTGSGGYTPLDRQALTPTPYAFYALDAGRLDGQHADAFVTVDRFEAADLDNLAANASFEFFRAGADTYPDRWILLGDAGPGYQLVSRVEPGVDGAYAVRVEDISTSRFCIQQQVYPEGQLPQRFRGQSLVLSVWARKTSDSGVAIGEIAINDGIARSAASLQDTPTWHSAVVVHTVAATATRLTVELCPVNENPADIGTYDFDAVMLTAGSFAPPFRPGILDRLAVESVAVAGLLVEGQATISGSLTLSGTLNGGTPWTSANDGSGSTLDADLLDGQHSDYYATAAHNHAGVYTPVGHTHLGGEITSAVAQAGNADTLDGQHGSAYQLRVSGACAVGSTIRAVNADGTVVCQLDAPLRRSAPPEANATTFVDTVGSSSGYHNSITLGLDGLPVISYFADGRLKVLHCGNVACTAGNTITAVDTTATVGYYTSIAIGTDGLPAVSYYDWTNKDLKVLHCGDAACTAGNTATTVDTPGLVATFTSIAIGADWLPVVSYWAQTGIDLKVLHCGNAACTAGNTATAVDTAGEVGFHNSITIGAAGLPVISYFDITNDSLKVLHCGNAACTAGNTATSVATVGDIEGWASITIGADGLPLVSYFDHTNDDLKVLYCGDAACTTGNNVIAVDTTDHVGFFSSITIGADGLPVISYYNLTNDGLKVLHCSSPFCVPYWRRR